MDHHSGFEMPPVPEIDPKHSLKPVRIAMPGVSPANSVRSTAQLGPVRALNITKKKGTELVTPRGSPSSSASADRTLVNSPEVVVASARPLTGYSTASSDDGVAHARARQVANADSDSESDDDDHSRAKQSLLPNSPTQPNHPSLGSSSTQDSPSVAQSPFGDNSSLDAPRPAMSQRIISYDTSSTSRAPMTPIVEEGFASKRGSTVSHTREQSPFADSNQSNL